MFERGTFLLFIKIHYFEIKLFCAKSSSCAIFYDIAIFCRGEFIVGIRVKRLKKKTFAILSL